MACLCPSCTQGSATFGQPYSFAYSYGHTADYRGTAYYTDEFFAKPASTYEPSLATASMCLAFSGFAANREIPGSYTKRFANGKEFLETLGFRDVTPNDFYKVKPTNDSFGTIMGHKPLGGKTLVAVSVRGGNYEAEWAGNFTIGEESKSKYAQGFLEASDIYLSSLSSYLEQNHITGPIVVWTAGYSRGGAAVNLAAGRLDEEIAKGTNTLLPGVSLAKDDLYAYCFEPPAGAYFEENDHLNYHIKGEAFSNIHCLLNLNDPVPLVAPKEWNFARYGNEYYLPDRLTVTDYDSQIQRVKGFYGKMENAAVLGEYKIDNFVKMGLFSEGKVLAADANTKNYRQSQFLNELLQRLGTALTRPDFVASAQPALRDLFALFFKNGAPKDSLVDLGIGIARSIVTMDSDEVLLTDLIHNPGAFCDDLEPLLRKALTESGLSLDIHEVIAALKTIFSALLKVVSTSGGIDALSSFLNIDNIRSLAQGHRPELCLSHLMAMDPNYGEASGKLKQSYYFLSAPSGTDFSIVHQNKTIAGFQEAKPLEIDSVFPYGKERELEIVYLPPDEEYDLVTNSDAAFSLYRVSVSASEPVQVEGPTKTSPHFSTAETSKA